MTRRGFLVGAAALALGAAARRALGDVSLKTAGTALSSAAARARRDGRPVLALVIPHEYAETLERGHAFGEWLTHGSDADVAPLALCEVACIHAAELDHALGWSNAAGDPLLAFIEYDRAPIALPQRLDARLPNVPWLCLWCTDQSASEREADLAIDQRIAALAGWARQRLERRDPSFAAASPERIAEWAAQARRGYRDRPPAGGRWAYAAQYGGALVGVEPPPRSGMEFIAKRTQRVLYLFDD